MDIYDKNKRRKIMSSVRSKGSKIELEFAQKLRKEKIKYRKNPKGYFGNPDFIIVGKKIAVFLDSCFWHGCKKHKNIPKTRKIFWKNKISKNKKRDREVTCHYKNNKWKIYRIWEHELKDKSEKYIINLKNLMG
ncbi:MAG: very short patch repair endonuclease [Elusimicrobiota bacterium]